MLPPHTLTDVINNIIDFLFDYPGDLVDWNCLPVGKNFEMDLLSGKSNNDFFKESAIRLSEFLFGELQEIDFPLGDLKKATLSGSASSGVSRVKIVILLKSGKEYSKEHVVHHESPKQA